MTTVLGIDGCRGGWLALRLDTATRSVALELAPDWRSLSFTDIAMVAVDMPIGLPDRGPRRCDREARALLPPGRKSSVFPAPRRYMLGCRSWQQAHRLGREREGTGLSKETWNIVGRIKDIDDALQPDDQERIREAHPELIFHRLACWQPVPSKRRPEGRRTRLELLAAAGLVGLEDRLGRYPRRQVAPDDVVDAAACALAASRMLAGAALRLPAEAPERDARGLRMEIWY